MKKFIRDIKGDYAKVSALESVGLYEYNHCCYVHARTESGCDYMFAKCKSKEEAQKWLDNFIHELEDDSPTNSDIRDRLLHLSDALGDIYEKLIGVADDDVISDFGEVLDELDDIIDDIKEN